jgi:uncharacterized membrane protein YhaH (DUF805 family)
VTTTQMLFSFRGRLHRAPYWVATLALMLMLVVGFLVTFIVTARASSIGEGLLGLAVVMAVLLVTHIPPLWIALAVGAKRLHDRNKSAWWLLLFYLAPALLNLAAEKAAGSGVAFTVAGIAVSIWALVELGVLRGTAGPNRYGADPLAAA